MLVTKESGPRFWSVGVDHSVSGNPGEKDRRSIDAGKYCYLWNRALAGRGRRIHPQPGSINCRDHRSYQSESGKADSKESERLVLGSQSVEDAQPPVFASPLS